MNYPYKYYKLFYTRMLKCKISAYIYIKSYISYKKYFKDNINTP